MYTTIDADIKNGRVMGPKAGELPASAHVLVKLLGSGEKSILIHFPRLIPISDPALYTNVKGPIDFGGRPYL